MAEAFINFTGDILFTEIVLTGKNRDSGTITVLTVLRTREKERGIKYGIWELKMS